MQGLPYIISGQDFGIKGGYFDSIRSSGILSLPNNSNFGVVGRWSGENYIGASNRPIVVNEGINGKCLRFDRAVNGSFNSVLAFNYDAPIALGQKIFASRWVKHSCPASVEGGQWKYERYQKVNNSVSDKPSEVYWNASSDVPDNDNKIQSRDYQGISAPTDDAIYGDSDVSKMPHNKNTWMRMDTLVTLPQSYGDNTFRFETWIYYDHSQQPFYTDFVTSSSGTNPYGQAGDEWTQHIYQNYFGNGDFGNKVHTLWMDKVSESVSGNDWRVEYCDSEDFSQRKVSFLQDHSSWSGDIALPYADKGTLSSGFLHVIKNGVSVHSRAV